MTAGRRPRKRTSEPAIARSTVARVFALLQDFLSGSGDASFSPMASGNLLARIASEPGKMGGKPIIRGRRIRPAMVLTMLANGASRTAILEAYPVLEPEDIDACLLYAARLSEAAADAGITVAAE
jgi:uncharacterized protein (DUF433 family)